MGRELTRTVFPMNYDYRSRFVEFCRCVVPTDATHGIIRYQESSVDENR